MSSSAPQVQTNGALAFERAPFIGVDGFNLSDFPLFPLSYQTQHLANTHETFQWTHPSASGEQRECFLHRKYGQVAPNGDTADYLLLLIHLLRQSDDPYTLRTNFHQLLTLRPPARRYKPNQQYLHAAIRHLDACQGLNIHTNAVYDRKRQRWLVARTNVLNYEYEDRDGKVRTRHIKRRRDDRTGFDVIESHETIKELADIHFSKAFIRHFARDTVPLDLATYFQMEWPTAKTLYRIANRYVQAAGGGAFDLKQFCLGKLGMSRAFVEKSPYVSKLAVHLKRHVQRVNETADTVRVAIEKDRTMPSGYRIAMGGASRPVTFSSPTAGFTERERQAFNALRGYGVYPNTAASIVRRCRRALGPEAADYIAFVTKRFEAKYLETGAIRAPQTKQGGVLARFFSLDLYYPAYMDWAHEDRLRRSLNQRSANSGGTLIGALALPMATGEGLQAPAPTPAPNGFSVQRFRETHPDVHRRIACQVTEKYERAGVEFPDLACRIDDDKERAIEWYCRQCFEAFRQGDTAFFPQILQDEQ